MKPVQQAFPQAFSVRSRHRLRFLAARKLGRAQKMEGGGGAGEAISRTFLRSPQFSRGQRANNGSTAVSPTETLATQAREERHPFLLEIRSHTYLQFQKLKGVILNKTIQLFWVSFDSNMSFQLLKALVRKFCGLFKNWQLPRPKLNVRTQNLHNEYYGNLTQFQKISHHVTRFGQRLTTEFFLSVGLSDGTNALAMSFPFRWLTLSEPPCQHINSPYWLPYICCSASWEKLFKYQEFIPGDHFLNSRHLCI